MTTDNRTNEVWKPTEAQVKLALDAFVGGDFYAEYPGSIPYWEPHMRAALVAAAGAAPQAENEPMYSLVSRQWSGSCPCVRAEQVDPECEWHGRPEFRIGGEFHHDSPGAVLNSVPLATQVQPSNTVDEAALADKLKHWIFQYNQERITLKTFARAVVEAIGGEGRGE